MPIPGNAAFIVVAPDGTITYDFDGHIHADGLDLYAGTTSSPPNDRLVRWLRQSDGALVRQIGAYDDGTKYSNIDDVLDPASAQNYAQRRARVDPFAVRSTIEDTAAAGGATVSRTIIDSDNRSSFIQTRGDTTVPKRSLVGSTTLTFPGGQAWQTSPAINHNWGTGPVRVFATMREFFASGGNIGPLALAGYGQNANALSIIGAIGQGFGNPAAGAIAVVDYILVET